MIEPEGVWQGAIEILDSLDAKSRPGDRLYGETRAERAATQATVAKLIELLEQPAYHFLLFQLLPAKPAIVPLAVDGAPSWERLIVQMFYPVGGAPWRGLPGWTPRKRRRRRGGFARRSTSSS